jgi:hypothetical protein
MSHRLVRLARAATLVALLLFPAGLSAQEEEPSAPAAPTPEDLLGRLRTALDRAEDATLRVRGSVALEAAGGADPFSGAVISANLMGGPPFEGDFEAWTDGAGKLVVVSKKPLPGFEVFRNDEREVIRVTYEGDAPNVKQLMSDLGALLDMSRVRKWMKRADLESKLDPATGAATYVGEAPRRLVPAAQAGLMGMAQEKILRVDASITIGKGGSLLEAEFRIQRSDPMAGMIRRANPFGEMEEPQDEGEVTKGKTSVYHLVFETADPSPRVRSFLRAAESLISKGPK